MKGKIIQPRVGLDRRAFLRQSFLAALSGVAVTVTACGYDGGNAGAGNQSGDGKTGSISGNHGHTAFVSSAQLSAGNSLVLQIRGSSDHPHTLSLSSAQVQAIASGTQVSVTSSSDDGHTHLVTFN